MRYISFLLVLVACGGKPGSVVIQEELCDGGMQSFTAVAQGDGGVIQVSQACGSPATTTILSAPCVTPEDGGPPVATFTLPAGFSAQRGDTITASVCATDCGDAGELCSPASVPCGEGPGDYCASGAPTTTSVIVSCGLHMCQNISAFLQVTE